MDQILVLLETEARVLLTNLGESSLLVGQVRGLESSLRVALNVILVGGGRGGKREGVKRIVNAAGMDGGLLVVLAGQKVVEAARLALRNLLRAALRLVERFGGQRRFLLGKQRVALRLLARSLGLLFRLRLLLGVALLRALRPVGRLGRL